MSTTWPKVPLGNVLQRVARFEERDELTEYQFAGTFSFARGIFVGDRKLGSTFKLPKVQRIHKGDFVYCKIMAWEGAFGIVPEKAHNCVMSGAFVAYDIDRKQIDPNYLDYYFKIERVWKSIGRQSTGTNVRRRSLHPKQFEAARIPLPPLDEQRRIVARIEELAALIEEAQALRLKAREETEALLASALRGVFFGLTQKPNCETTQLGRVAELRRGRFSHRPRNDPRFFGGDHPWIQIGEIESAGKYITDYKETLNDEGLAISRKFLKGTLLISIAATIGAIGILSFDCCVPDSIVAVIPDETKTTSEFLYYFLAYTRSHLEEIAPQSAQKNINLRILQPLPISLPPLDGQHRIVAYLDSLQTEVGQLTATQDATQAELEALLPSVLDQAFRGEL